MGSLLSLVKEIYGERSAPLIVAAQQYTNVITVKQLRLVQLGQRRTIVGQNEVMDAVVITADDVLMKLGAFENIIKELFVVKRDVGVLRAELQKTQEELRYFTDLRDAQIEFDLQKNKINK